MSATAATALSVQPLEGAQFGAEIRGLNPGNISADDKQTIWDTYRDRHGLICFSFDRLLEAEELHALLPRAPRASRPEQRDGFVNDGLLDLAGSAGLVLLDRLPSAGVGLGGPSSCSSSSGDAGAQRSSSTSSCTGWAFADDRLTSSALLLRAHEAFD